MTIAVTTTRRKTTQPNGGGSSSSSNDDGTIPSSPTSSTTTTTTTTTIDIKDCLCRGAIGSLGAIPGTFAAHPLDLTKIRMQISSSTTTTTYAQALAQTQQAPMAGVVSGIRQKVLTRGPMFFWSEVFTQVGQNQMGWNRDTAVLIGSFASGYMTGFCASLAEWQKVLQATTTTPTTTTTTTNKKNTHLLFHSIRQGQGQQQRQQLVLSVLRRMRGAGLRNGIFDATFFGTEHYLHDTWKVSHAMSFAMAAGVAVLVDYPVDVVVKQSMAKGITETVSYGPIMATIKLLQKTTVLGAVNTGKNGIGQVYRGIGCKGAEFATSYFVTGLCAPVIKTGVMMVLAASAATTSSSLWSSTTIYEKENL